MKFWDASAIVPLLITEPTTKTLQTLAEKDSTMIAWWATEVECALAIARLERDSALDEAAVTQAFHRLKHSLMRGTKSIRVIQSVTPPCGSCGCIPLRVTTRFSSRRPSPPRNADRHRSKSSHSTTVCRSLREKKDSG